MQREFFLLPNSVLSKKELRHALTSDLWEISLWFKTHSLFLPLPAWSKKRVCVFVSLCMCVCVFVCVCVCVCVWEREREWGELFYFIWSGKLILVLTGHALCVTWLLSLLCFTTLFPCCCCCCCCCCCWPSWKTLHITFLLLWKWNTFEN